MRDFVFIDDVVAVNLWFLDNPDKSGIFNLGSGRAQPFNDVALSVVNSFACGAVSAEPWAKRLLKDLIEYIPFPRRAARQIPELYTQADLTALCAATGVRSMRLLMWRRGVKAYMANLSAQVS
jgi:ADP-L-glycero-D-manno-heptose 6-epimerase